MAKFICMCAWHYVVMCFVYFGKLTKHVLTVLLGVSGTSGSKGKGPAWWRSVHSPVFPHLLIRYSDLLNNMLCNGILVKQIWLRFLITKWNFLSELLGYYRFWYLYLVLRKMDINKIYDDIGFLISIINYKNNKNQEYRIIVCLPDEGIIALNTTQSMKKQKIMFTNRE